VDPKTDDKDLDLQSVSDDLKDAEMYQDYKEYIDNDTTDDEELASVAEDLLNEEELQALLDEEELNAQEQETSQTDKEEEDDSLESLLQNLVRQSKTNQHESEKL
jgi:hypothetical protein